MSSEGPKAGSIRCCIAVDVKCVVRRILSLGVDWSDVRFIKIIFGSGYTLYSLHRLLEGD